MFESFLSKYNSKSSYSLEIIANLINKYQIPKFQRPLNVDRLNSLSNNIKLKFNPITPIYFCVLNSQRWLIDGQHRIFAYTNDELIKKQKIPIIDIYVNDEDEIFEYFKLINDTMTLNDIYIDENENKKELINNVYNYFIDKYPNTFKYRGKCRPFLNSNDFLNQLDEIYEEKKFTHSQQFINIIEDLNNNYSKMDCQWFTSKGNTKNQNLLSTVVKNNCLYLGMCKNDWPNHLDSLPDNNNELNVTLGFKQSIWNKYCGDVYKRSCLCCNTNEISVFNFECGHITSRKNGGKISIDNIVPICSFCNKSMGTTHMIKYMNKMNYNKSF